MGNCYGSPVNNHSSSKHPTPVTPRTNRKQNGVAERNPSCKASGNNGNEISGITERSASKAAVILSKSSSNNINININITERAGSTAAHDDDAAAPNETLMVRSAPKVKEFTLAELKKATRDFRPDTILGEGGFGRVFKGWIDEETYAPSKAGIGIAVAVKKSSPDSYQGHQEWQAEVDFLGKYRHPNLVRLLGHCCEENQFLLVYEYMPKGSLENHLFRKGQEPLQWETRLKIAIGAARGLAYLHTSEKVIYRDFKASNVLLDPDFNAKLSDFGLAKLGPLNGNSHVTTRVLGTYGYAAPEYIATGHLYVKSDVYGFGVVLLELLTGLRALDNNRPVLEHCLVDWARPSLHKKRAVRKIMDPRLEEQYPLKAACQTAELILKCLESDPKNRPSMEEVLVILEKVNSIKEKPKSTKSANGRRRQDEHSSAHQHRYNHYRSPNHQNHGGNIGVGSQPRVC